MNHFVNLGSTRDRLLIVAAFTVFFIAAVITFVIIVASSLGRVDDYLTPSAQNDVSNTQTS